MQNIGFRVPGIWENRVRYAIGGPYDNLNAPSSGRIIIRTQSGYRGQRQYDIYGRLINHTYNFNYQDFVLERSYHGYSYDGHYDQVAKGPYLFAGINGATVYPAYNWESLYNDALDKLTEKVRGSLDLAIDLAEAGQTIKMFKLMDKVVDYTKVFKRKYGLLKGFGNAWLEYTYGVKPLLSSIYGIADENLRYVINHTQGFSARKTDKDFKPGQINLLTVQGSKDLDILKSECKRSLTIGIGLTLDQFDLSRWTSLNPVSIAWELTPLSFVADWALNVGGYLRNMETAALNSSKFRGGYVTKLSVSDIKIAHGHSGQNEAGNGYVEDHTFGTFKGVDITRTVLLDYPIPTLPSFDVKLGSSRMLSAASLLAGLLGRR